MVGPQGLNSTYRNRQMMFPPPFIARFCFADCFAREKMGKRIAAKTAIMAMTAISSIGENALGISA